MLLRIFLAFALASGLSSAAQAQTALVVQDCVGVAAASGDGRALIVDQAGRLCTVAVGASGSVMSPGANGSQAQAVQGVNGGVPQNVNLLPANGSAAGIAPVTSSASGLVAKTSAGNLYGFGATFGATAGFIAVLNASAVPSAGAAISPVECVPVAVNASYRTRQDIPDRYGTGIALVATSSCTTYTAVTPVVLHAVVQ